MKKYNFFQLLIALGLFGKYAVSDDGAGMDQDERDEFDIDIEDDEIEQEEKPKEEPKKEEPKDNKKLEEATKRLEALEREIAEQNAQKEFDNAINEIKSKHNDFDKDKVHQYLKELHKKDPQKAEELNSKVGWELIWVNELKPKEVENDNPNFGRNIDPIDRANEVLEQVVKGGVTLADEQDVIGKFL